MSLDRSKSLFVSLGCSIKKLPADGDFLSSDLFRIISKCAWLVLMVFCSTVGVAKRVEVVEASLYCLHRHLSLFVVGRLRTYVSLSIELLSIQLLNRRDPSS